jgi:hypothetical protein
VIEAWKPWRSGDYEVSNLGRVRRARPGRRTYVGRILTWTFLSIGYPTVGLTIGGKNKRIYVHELVAECFIGPRPDGAEVNHIDGDKANPVVTNLEYVTHRGNMQHASRSGLMPVGEASGNSKLTNADVLAMRAAWRDGARNVELARRFGVSRACVSQVVHRHHWRHLP